MYPIMYKEEPVGRAAVCREGMFLKIDCRCRLQNKCIYRVVVSDDRNQYDLGICVPAEDSYTCVGRIARSKLLEDNLSFAVICRDETVGIQITTGRPFAHLDKLNAAHLRIANGQPKIMIDPIQDQQDSDRNP